MFHAGGGAPQKAQPRIPVDRAMAWSAEQSIRFIGAYTARSDSGFQGPAAYDPDAFKVRTEKRWVEYLKFCPAVLKIDGTTVKDFAIKREAGMQVLDIDHGSTATVQVRVSRYENGSIRLKTTPEFELKPTGEAAASNGGFLHSYTASTRMAVDELAYRLVWLYGNAPISAPHSGTGHDRA